MLQNTHSSIPTLASVEFRHEELTEDWARSDAVTELTKNHYEEIAKFKGTLTLKPDIDRYVRAARNDLVHLVTAHYRPTRILIGYSIHFLYNHLHYRDLKCAEDDIHYIRPMYRNIGVGSAMRSFALDGLKGRGVQFVTARCKIGHEHEASLSALGFKPLDITYARELATWPSTSAPLSSVD